MTDWRMVFQALRSPGRSCLVPLGAVAWPSAIEPCPMKSAVGMAYKRRQERVERMLTPRHNGRCCVKSDGLTPSRTLVGRTEEPMGRSLTCPSTDGRERILKSGNGPTDTQ